jgi:hypothetical protein
VALFTDQVDDGASVAATAVLDGKERILFADVEFVKEHGHHRASTGIWYHQFYEIPLTAAVYNTER